MSESQPVLQSWTENYTTLETLGMLTAAMVLALIVIALLFRFIKSLCTIRHYDAACQQLKTIEGKLAEMTGSVEGLKLEYERLLAETNEQRARENFELRQLVFQRNSEILDLQNKILVMSKLAPL